MGGNRHIVDPDRLAETFGIEWEKSDLHTFLDNEDNFSYCFKLKDKRGESGVELYINDETPNKVYLNIEQLNEYTSTINFGNITKVVYIPEYRKVRFESHTKTHYSVLEIYWRGQFGLIISNDEKYYSESVWGKKESLKK